MTKLDRRLHVKQNIKNKYYEQTQAAFSGHLRVGTGVYGNTTYRLAGSSKLYGIRLALGWCACRPIFIGTEHETRKKAAGAFNAGIRG